MKKKREEFKKSTREIIAGRAGYRCSFPRCNKTLVGPGFKSSEWITIGEFSHIFSAEEGGPRTNGNLSKEELKKPENGIYLCRHHHKIVDSKSQDNFYTSDLLTRFKNFHEFKIAAEIGEYIYPLTWIKNVKFSGGIFQETIDFNFGKVTFITGSNGTGKSTIVEIIGSVFRQRLHSRWKRKKEKFKLAVSLDNIVMSEFSVELEENDLKYYIQGREFPFVPFDFLVLHLSDGKTNIHNDVQTIANCLGQDESFIENVITTTTLEHGIFTQNVILKKEDGRKKLYIKKDKRIFSFHSLSSTEQSSVIFDIVISYASQLSKFKSVLLIIDWSNLNAFSDSNLKPYLEYLQTSKAHFQTLFVSHTERPYLDWTGWVIAKLFEEDDQVKLNQTEK